MDGNGQYPAPDFGCPPPSSFTMPPTSQHLPPRSSSFHPGMWNWHETPTFDPRAHDDSGRGGWPGGPPRPPPAAGNYDGRYDGSAGPGGQHFHRGWHRGRGHHNGPPNNYGNKQKFKKEPEYAYFCDTCDRGFKTEEIHSEHMSQHIKCSFPDCNFTAHEKIVSIHWKNSHAPGAKRIKLDTPEEITKWKEDRRRNYPTLGNIEEKRKVQDVREEGGGVLETVQFGGGPREALCTMGTALHSSAYPLFQQPGTAIRWGPWSTMSQPSPFRGPTSWYKTTTPFHRGSMMQRPPGVPTRAPTEAGEAGEAEEAEGGAEALLATDIRHERNVLLQCVRYTVRSAFFGLEKEPRRASATPVDDDDAVPEVKRTDSGCQGEVPDERGPRLACADNDVDRQTRSAKATLTRAAEETPADCPGTSEMEVDKSGTGEKEQTTASPSDSEEKQSSEQVACVPMAEETHADQGPDAATTAPEEATPTGVYDDEIWEY
ncbi:hypothetical protein NHX12_014521 [Muraenolepis orangiensis]|uniref:C2H2-type domain-containing protein n=1 Tax=Muraenolepis orangiensis TaxID=630683 RepID=A0A9Q0D8U7_9TELE|nr:hypothetical protein NHX12_014521 [Muraenolepis orangiensis]